MIKYENILVAMDFSEPSVIAYQHAKALASALGARLHVLHVVDDPMLTAHTTSDDYREEFEQKCQQKLAAEIEQLGEEGLEVKQLVKTGNPQDILVEYCHDYSVDLVVMGTKGRSGLADVLLGSVAQRLLHAAPCPVLSVTAKV